MRKETKKEKGFEKNVRILHWLKLPLYNTNDTTVFSKIEPKPDYEKTLVLLLPLVITSLLYNLLVCASMICVPISGKI